MSQNEPEQAETHVMSMTAVPNESPVVISTFNSTWSLHDPSNQAPGHILMAGHEVPSSIRMIPEFRVLLTELLKLPGVTFVILAAYSQYEFHVGHTSLTTEESIRAHSKAVLATLGITVHDNS